MTRWARAVAALALLGLLLGVRADAYVLSGHRWNATEVPYLVNVDSCTGTGLVRASVLADMQTAAHGWYDQTNANIRLVYAGETTLTGFTPDRLNTVFCTSEPDASGVIGQAYWWYGGDQFLYDVDIQLHLGNYPYLTSDQPCDAPAVYVLDIAIHEFGHALGLAHSAELPATMWAPTSPCSTKERTLYSDDILGIEAVYGPRVVLPPDPTPVLSCTTDGLVHPLGDHLAFTGANGPAAQWLTARQLEGWVLFSRIKARGTTTLVVQCGLIDVSIGQGL